MLARESVLLRRLVFYFELLTVARRLRRLVAFILDDAILARSITHRQSCRVYNLRWNSVHVDVAIDCLWDSVG